MRRRDFILSSAGIGLGATLGCGRVHAPKHTSHGHGQRVIPESIGGRTLLELREELNKHLNTHFSFFDRGGDDKQYGGYMCILNDLGAPINDEKYIWFQGRGIWTYSYMYNHFGRDERWLDSARRARDFMVRHMYAGDGRWVETVRRDGKPLKPVSGSIYDWMFPAEGLIELYKATGNKEDLELAITSIKAAQAAYDQPGYAPPEAPLAARVQGHSMVMIHTLRQLLEIHTEPWAEALQREHVDAVLHRFYNPDLRVSNENLKHDFSRIEPDYTMLGHSLETRWMIMFEALRRGDRALFDEAGSVILDWIPMGWDFNMDGWGCGDYWALDSAAHPHGAFFNKKTMWGHAETLIACATLLEYTGEPCYADWYGRTMDYLRRVFAHADRPWSLVAVRNGQTVETGNDANRKDNYHPPRCMMMCMQSLDRMMKNDGRLTPFPAAKTA